VRLTWARTDGVKVPCAGTRSPGLSYGRQGDRSTRQKQLRDREVPWEGSRSQTCEPTNRNAIPGRRSGQAGTTQQRPVFSFGGKWRGCTGRVRILTQGDLLPEPGGNVGRGVQQWASCGGRSQPRP
jgi:hypothetical protein